MTEKEAYVAFNLTEQIGSVGVGEGIAKYGSVASAWEAYPKKVSRSGGEVLWEEEFEKASKFGVAIVTPADEEYPAILRDTPGRPLALYVKGDLSALSRPSLAIIGTRRATPYGLEQAYGFAMDLASDGWGIVSGLALGIDAEAHRGALAAKGITVGVLGSGLDQFYPEQNRDLAREIVRNGGAVISEFPFGRVPDMQTFPQRNHVVAGLVKGVVAIESPMKSGTLITTSIAADLGRTVMALPGRVDNKFSAGCLHLIREGAILVRHARDVADAMSELIANREKKMTGETDAPSRVSRSRKNSAFPEKPVATATEFDFVEPPFSVEESLIMKHVDSEGISMDELVRLTKLSAAKVNSICMTLRVKGRVRFFPGNRVALPRSR